MGQFSGLTLPQLIQAVKRNGFSPEWAEATVEAVRFASGDEMHGLSELLRIDDKEIRHGVANLMANSADLDAIKLLVESALEEEDEVVVRVATVALMNMRGAAVDLLRHVMRSNSGIVHVRAALILAEIGNAEGVPILVDVLASDEIVDRDILPRLIRSLGQLRDPRGIHALVSALAGADWLLRPVAARALVGVGEAAVPELLQVIRTSHDWDARCRAAEAVGLIGSWQATQPLVELMGTNEGFVQYQIVESLGRIGDPSAVGALIDALVNGDPTLRFRAGVALVHMGPPANEGLAGIIRDHVSADVRRSATEAMGRIGTDLAIPTLIEALHDSNALVRRAAAEALGANRDRRAVLPLCRALQDENWIVVRGAADALAEIRDTQAVMPLMRALSDERSEVRRRALKALEHFGPLVETLTDGLDSDDTVTRIGVIDALGELRGQKVTDALLYGLGDSDHEVRTAAARALLRSGEGELVLKLKAIVDQRGPGADELQEELKRQAGT